MKTFTQRLAAKSALAVAAMFTATAVPALAQPMEAMPSMHNSALTPMDRSFVTDMLQEARAQQAFAKLALQRTSNVSTVRAANATYDEWTDLRGRLAGLAMAEAAPVRGALTASQQTELWNLGRAPKSRFDRVFLLDAQRGNQLALNRIRDEDATSNVQMQHFLDEARPLISGYQAMLTADIGRFPLTARMPLEGLGSTIQ